MSTIGEALRNARKTAGIKQVEIARALGIKPQFLVNIENGAKPLPLCYYGKLPEPIRSEVINAALLELGRQAKELEALR